MEIYINFYVVAYHVHAFHMPGLIIVKCDLVFFLLLFLQFENAMPQLGDKKTVLDIWLVTQSQYNIAIL